MSGSPLPAHQKTARKWKQPKHLLMDDRFNKMWSVHTADVYTDPAAARMNAENTTPSGSQTQKATYLRILVTGNV